MPINKNINEDFNESFSDYFDRRAAVEAAKLAYEIGVVPRTVEIITSAPAGTFGRYVPGSGKSSWGHTAVAIDDNAYSLGPEGWGSFTKADYLKRNSFRDNFGQELYLTDEEKRKLNQILRAKCTDDEPYDRFVNNCVQGVQEALREAAPRPACYEMGPNNGPTPFEFKRDLQRKGHVLRNYFYPQSHAPE